MRRVWWHLSDYISHRRAGEAYRRCLALASIEVKRRGDVRRAKLYYLRSRSGKSARIKEKLDYKAFAAKAKAKAQAAQG